MQQTTSLTPIIEDIVLTDLSTTPQQFFDLLPPEWQEDLIPGWESYSSCARIFCFLSDEQPIAGGVLFHDQTGETELYGEIATNIFSSRGLYIGYLWVVPPFRGQKLATRWIETVASKFAGQPLWLAVEDPALGAFYGKNGFTELTTFATEGGTDILYLRK